MYSPLASNDNDRDGGRPPSYKSTSQSLQDNDEEAQEVELADLSNTALLSARSTEYSPHEERNDSPTKNLNDRAASISSLSVTSEAHRSRKAVTWLAKKFRLPEDITFKEREDTRPGRGLWAEQMLVDRTLRSMAALMTAFAIVMVVTCISLAKSFRKHIELNPHSTSVTIDSGSESSMTRKSEAIKFLINVAATMILGMSNTYQQLLTALKVDDLKHALFKYGDSRVGTNSPFAINHKRKGRLGYWLAWALLISTSMPVHLLANSVIGVSDYYDISVPVSYKAASNVSILCTSNTTDCTYYNDFPCWSALRLGHNRIDPADYTASIPQEYDDAYYANDYYGDTCKPNKTIPNPMKNSEKYSPNYKAVTVVYQDEACGQYINSSATTVEEVSTEFYGQTYVSNCTSTDYSYCTYANLYLPGCFDTNFTCAWELDEDNSNPGWHSFHLVLRMQAAIVLACCISIKAIYMVTTNIRARHKIKSHCLTFGDILVASTLDPALRIPNECMVNGGDFHRRQVAHICHKHCKGKEPSETGEELGHCQKCKKFNLINNIPGLPWPALAMKRKKSLISNLGQTALTQMLTLSFASTGMIAASILMAIVYTQQYAYAVCMDWTTFREQFARNQQVAVLSMNSIWGEVAAFCISNGAQLLYSMLYLLLLYNLTLISMEYDWGKLEKGRGRLRCTIVKSERFDQSYLLQLPKKVLFPIMVYSVLMHWLLGLAILAEEKIVNDEYSSYSQYTVVTVPDAVWGSSALLLAMTAGCWWAFTYRREGFIPQMFGSIRTLCASTSELDAFPMEGVQWGDLGKDGQWRHAGFSSGPVGPIHPNQLYAGRWDPDMFDDVEKEKTD